jgi:putative FmdB family regulatory protein
MPIYEFKCDACQLIEETNIPGWKEGQSPNCFKCNEPMRRVISMPAGVHFKGSGFYETDYKRK